MLHDLSFINTGQFWPPKDADEAARLAEHKKNRLLYDELHEKIFPAYGKYLADKKYDDKKQKCVLGWAETATTCYIDLLMGDAPKIEAPYVYDIPDEEVFIDDSRYGFGLFEITQDSIIAANPENVYLVTIPGNMRDVQAYVFFHEFSIFVSVSNAKKVGPGNLLKELRYVKFTIHEKGSIHHLLYLIKGEKLDARQNLANFPAFADLKVDAEGYQYPFGVDPKTGLPPEDAPMLIVRVDNSLASDRYCGRSDYTPAVHDLIEILERAFSWRFEVLGKFARPIPNVPESAMTFNHGKQQWEFRTDEAMIIEEGSTPASYLVWQAQLRDVEVEINGAMKELLMKLKLSDVLLAGEATTGRGAAQSGTALGIRLIPTVSRVRKFASAYKKVIPLVLSLKSKLDESLGQLPVDDDGDTARAFEKKEVKVVMKDGIPSIPAEEAATRAANTTALMALFTNNILDIKTTLKQALLLRVITKEALLPLVDDEAEKAIDAFAKQLEKAAEDKATKAAEALKAAHPPPAPGTQPNPNPNQIPGPNVPQEAAARGGRGLPIPTTEGP